MKFKRCMNAIYSSALVLGLSFLLYPQTTPAVVSNPTLTPTPAATATPAPNVLVSTPETDPVIQPTTTPETVIKEVPKDTIPSALLDNTLYEPFFRIPSLVTDYINAYYSNDVDTLSTLVTDATLIDTSAIEKASENISKVEDIQLYAKPGIENVFSIVYATYSVYYKDLQISVPQFSEYYVTQRPDGSYLIQTEPLSEKAEELFLQARKTDAVQKLTISTLIQRYHNACLIVNEPLLRQCVTNADYLNLPYITSRYSVTESFADYDFLLHPGINEFESIVFVTHSEKIVFSSTPAPCMEYYYIDLDESGIPSIYLGITSLDTDAYCAAVIKSEEIQALAKEVNTEMQSAILADDDLMDFYQLLVSNSSTE